MKIGVRKPSIKKSVKARTTGKIERSIKKSINPIYGNKGIGFPKNPVKSINNSIYHKSTIGVSDILNSNLNSSSNNRNNNATDNSNSFTNTQNNKSSISKNNKLKILLVVLIFLLFLFARAIFIELNKSSNNNTENHQNIQTNSENAVTENIKETDTQIQTNSNENENSFNEQPVENTIVEEVPIVTPTIPNDTQTPVLEQPETETTIEQNKNETTETYILNTNTKKFHKGYCSSIKQIKSSNYSEFTGTRDEIINKGYSPCGKCKP